MANLNDLSKQQLIEILSYQSDKIFELNTRLKDILVEIASNPEQPAILLKSPIREQISASEQELIARLIQSQHIHYMTGKMSVEQVFNYYTSNPLDDYLQIKNRVGKAK